MAQIPLNHTLNNQTPDPGWKDMYRVGAISCIALLVSITIAIAAFYIWPYKLGGAPVQEIFVLLHNDRLAGLMSLELQMLLVQPVMVLTSFALYAALKQVNGSFALIALTLGIMGNLLMFSARPVNELIYLSDRYIATTNEILKNQYLVAGESYLALYEGTGFTAATISISVAGVINALLMLKSHFFSKAAGVIGAVSSVLGISIFIPAIGPALSFAGTIGAVAWNALLARSFFHFGWKQGNEK
jgi:hypothetical protein